jgi:hypothetical protein
LGQARVLATGAARPEGKTDGVAPAVGKSGTKLWPSVQTLGIAVTTTANTMNRAPLILAIVMLLLPVLYVGSYFVLVTPGRGLPLYLSSIIESKSVVGHYTGNYRCQTLWADRVFWPLEQIDRKLRSGTWKIPDLSHYRGGPTRAEVPDLLPNDGAEE